MAKVKFRNIDLYRLIKPQVDPIRFVNLSYAERQKALIPLAKESCEKNYKDFPKTSWFYKKCAELLGWEK